MHGLVNRAIQQLIVSEHGHDTWLRIATRAGWAGGEFVSMGIYEDSMSYKLVGAASDVLGCSSEEILEALGGHWMRFTAQEGYGPLLDMVGDSFEEFLDHIDDMLTRVGLTLPGLRPPSFTLERVTDKSWDLHYHSHRPGFASMVTGIVQALAERFGTRVDVTHAEEGSQAEESCLVFHIREREASGSEAA